MRRARSTGALAAALLAGLAVAPAQLGCDSGGPRSSPSSRASSPATAAAPGPTGPEEQPWRPPPEEPQVLTTIDLTVGRVQMTVEVAHTPEQTRKGLMYRRDLPADGGMLFCFVESDFRSFWMRNTPLPLSIAYIDEDGVIAQIEDMQPFDETSIPSNEPVPFALEVHQGFFKRKGIAVGDRVQGLEQIFVREDLRPR